MSDSLDRLTALQEADLPVHGGRTLAYVYDSGLPAVDRLGREAVAAYAAAASVAAPVPAEDVIATKVPRRPSVTSTPSASRAR